jgi:hypothetical protein
MKRLHHSTAVTFFKCLSLFDSRVGLSYVFYQDFRLGSFWWKMFGIDRTDMNVWFTVWCTAKELAVKSVYYWSHNYRSRICYSLEFNYVRHAGLADNGYVQTMCRQWLCADTAPHRQWSARRSGLVVSASDSGSDEPVFESRRGTRKLCVASLDKMFTHTMSQAHPAWPSAKWGVSHVPTNRALARCAR